MADPNNSEFDWHTNFNWDDYKPKYYSDSRWDELVALDEKAAKQISKEAAKDLFDGATAEELKEAEEIVEQPEIPGTQPPPKDIIFPGVDEDQPYIRWGEFKFTLDPDSFTALSSPTPYRSMYVEPNDHSYGRVFHTLRGRIPHGNLGINFELSTQCRRPSRKNDDFHRGPDGISNCHQTTKEGGYRLGYEALICSFDYQFGEDKLTRVPLLCDARLMESGKMRFVFEVGSPMQIELFYKHIPDLFEHIEKFNPNPARAVKTITRNLLKEEDAPWLEVYNKVKASMV